MDTANATFAHKNHTRVAQPTALEHVSIGHSSYDDEHDAPSQTCRQRSGKWARHGSPTTPGRNRHGSSAVAGSAAVRAFLPHRPPAGGDVARPAARTTLEGSPLAAAPSTIVPRLDPHPTTVRTARMAVPPPPSRPPPHAYPRVWSLPCVRTEAVVKSAREGMERCWFRRGSAAVGRAGGSAYSSASAATRHWRCVCGRGVGGAAARSVTWQAHDV